MNRRKTRIFTALQPSGKLHIGNYLGMLKHTLALQRTHDTYLFIADLHSLTQKFNPKDKTDEIFELMVDFLALGFNPKKCTLSIQSHIPAHNELTWILNCITPYGELKRMTQFKDKSIHDPRNINVGLFTYPILQAADILLYKPSAVPIGRDQQQHLELSRRLARSFNNQFGKTLVEPRPLFTDTPVIMSLNDPTKKMSKSHGIPNILAIDDELAVIRRKIGKAVTTPQGVANLFTLLKEFTPAKTYTKFKKLEKDGILQNKELKDVLSISINKELKKYRERKKKLMKDKSAVARAYAEGTKKARKVAGKTMDEVKRRVGLV